METKGFGYLDAFDVPNFKPEVEWIVEDTLPRGIGFIAGLPKGGNSPHGGKSVYSRAIGYSIVSGEDFMGHKVVQKGKVLTVNLDEPPEMQSKYFMRYAKGQEIRGYMISKAYVMNFPNDLNKLEEDIKELKPTLVNIDPLLRVLGGRDIKEQKNTGPIIDAFKYLHHKYGVSFYIAHHSTKSPDRDKESTATWLSGSIELDSAWDFCHCLEWHRDWNIMHMRAFFRVRPRIDFYYEAETENEHEIIGLTPYPEFVKHSYQLRRIYRILQKNPKISTHEIARVLNMPQSTVRYHLQSLSKVSSSPFTKEGGTAQHSVIKVDKSASSENSHTSSFASDCDEKV